MSYSTLHNHTHYSFQDGLTSVEEIFKRASDLGIKAIALTEHGNLCSAPYACKIKKEYQDIKYIIGFEAYECFDINIKDKDSKYFHLVILAKNEQGRIGINNIITSSEFYGKYYKPRVDLNMLKPYADHLIVLSACLASKLSKENDFDKCVDYINEYKAVFDNFYLEMQSHDTSDQELYNKKILKLSEITNTPFVITTDSHADTKEQLKYQGIHVQIAHDADSASESYQGCYLQSEDEIHEIMDKQIGRQNVNTGLKNTNLVADLIDDNVTVPFQEPKLPPFPIPHEYQNEKEYIGMLIEKGWYNRKFDLLTEQEQEIRKERIAYELSVIDKMGYIGYFLIIWDLMEWGKKNGVIFGDGGRGSGAGSLVCYLLKITGLDPVKYNLIFERFLNPERVGMPDIDIDLYPKEVVINYLREKYGTTSVCQIINFSYITPAVAIKDVARILDRDAVRFEKYGRKIGVKEASEISKFFTERNFDDCVTLNERVLSKYDHEFYYDLFDIARVLSGRVRHASIHAGGVGIVETTINDYMPMKMTDKNEQVIQVDKKIVEEIGIVKFDLLGLGTLSIIKEAKELAGLSDFDIDPNNDEFLIDNKMYELISSGKTNCVFQLESQGMKDCCVKINPKNIEEISDILALYRPDTMHVLEDYIQRKNGLVEVSYLHKDMKPILQSTYGLSIYQEQNMQITRVFGGRSYAGADNFRKIIGKKLLDKVKPEVEKLHGEILKNGYDQYVSDAICNTMENFGNYQFNKSHSMGYSVITLQTAYLKAHYPVEFFCAVLNSCGGDTGKINKYIIEAQENGVDILPPHINLSEFKFTVIDGKVLFGLNSINGIGDILSNTILSERKENGKFNNMGDFLNRTKCNTSHIVQLIKSGSFPTKDKREYLIKYLNTYAVKDDDVAYKEYTPVKSLPTLIVLKTEYDINIDKIKTKEERLQVYNDKRKVLHDTVKKQEWIITKAKKQQDKSKELIDKYCTDAEYWEFESLSIFLSDNPFKKIQEYLRTSFSDISEGDSCIIAGVISSVQKKKDRNKKQYCYINVYGSFGIIEGICWNSVYEKKIDLIKKGNKLVFKGEKNSEDTFIIKDIDTIEEWLNRTKR